jgi:hypothetical protein
MAAPAMLVSIAASSALVYLTVFNFDADNALDKWSTMILNGPVEYRLMKQGTNGYVEALSDAACSALYYRLSFDLEQYRILSWRWRVLKFPDKSTALTKTEHDDYAARIYVIFPFLTFSSSQFIEYIWDEHLPAGVVMDSPRGSNIKQIVVRSGPAPEGKWFTEARNVYDDYAKAFGKKPGRSVGAIAIMCNADNTKSTAEALFDQIEIASESGAKMEVRSDEHDKEKKVSGK